MNRAHSPTFASLHLRHSSFSNPSVASPTSYLILQPFRCFTYVTAHFSTLSLLHLRHSSFSNPSFAPPTSQTLHLRHLARRPWFRYWGSLSYIICYTKFSLLIFTVLTRKLSIAMACRKCSFQPGGPNSIPGGIGDFNLYPETGRVSFLLCPVLSLSNTWHSADRRFRETRSCALI